MLLVLFSELAQKGIQLTTKELQTSFGLASYVIHELLNTSASRSNSLASTPSTPLPRTPSDSPSLGRALNHLTATHRQLSEDGFVRQFEGLKSLVVVNYLEFFSSFLDSRVLNQSTWHSSNGDSRNHFKVTFSGACELLLLSARLSPNLAIIETEHTSKYGCMNCLHSVFKKNTSSVSTLRGVKLIILYIYHSK